MKNFEFEHEGKKYWYSRSVAVLGMIVGYKDGAHYILANKRGANTPDFQGCWCMPCGYVDFNETTEEAIARETFEETGVKLDISEFCLHSVDSIPDDEKQNITIRYQTKNAIDINKHRLTSENAEIGEVDNIRWIKLANIGDYKWAFSHDFLIKRYVLEKNV